MLVSAFLHAAWNILARRSGNAHACIWRMQLFIVLIGAVPASIGLLLGGSIPTKAASCLLGSGVSCGFYFVCLAQAYKSGDFTTVYPAARALPVLLVGVGDVLRGQSPTLLGWLGMGLIALGCLFVPLTSFTGLRISHYWKTSSLWILLTAAGTVGYSLFDKIGTEAIPRGPHHTIVYCYFFFVVTVASYVLLNSIIAKRTTESADIGWRVPAVVGTLCFSAYWLVLCAYQMTERAGYVVACRQFSIVISMVAAIYIFNETGRAIRCTGSVVIMAGLILIKVFGAD